MSDPFAGRSAIVTGAASGIGREIARQLAARGAHVLVTDLPGSKLEEAAEEIRAGGGSAEAKPLDVTDAAQLRAAVADVVERHGRLDFMFNNAGVAIFGEFETVSLEEWDRTIDVNLRGVAYGATIAYEQMVTQGSGHIVNTASVAGLVPVPLQAHYTATKHAVVGMSKTLAVEAREKGVTVTAFCPAFVESGMFDDNTLHGSLEGVDTRRIVPVKPLPTHRAVAALMEGVEKRKEIVITPFYGRLGWLLERVSPALAMRLHRFTLKETRKRASRVRT